MGEVSRLGPLLGIYSGFGPISAVSDPPRVIPSHVWMIMDPSWGSWGRLDDFSNFELFLERLKTAVTQENTKMTKKWSKMTVFGTCRVATPRNTRLPPVRGGYEHR